MEILSLSLVIAESDLNAMSARHLPSDAPIRNLNFAIFPEGVQVGGEYRGLLLPVPFTTLWSVTVEANCLVGRLSRSRIVGVPASLLHGIFWSAFRKAASGQLAVRVENNAVHLHLDEMLQQRGLPLRTNLRTVRCEVGRLIIEAGGL